MTRTLFAAVLLASLLGSISSWGCQSGAGSGTLISSAQEYKPDALAFDRCILDLAGTKYKAEVQKARANGTIRLDLKAFGQVIETEEYATGPNAFGVSDAGGERYEPAIDLLRFPMRVGDSWDWQGNLNTGPIAHQAKAKVTTTSEDLPVRGETLHGVIRVQVDLEIDSGLANKPSKRRLVFDIARERGVVKRAFGDYSMRAPAED